ncbi:MAG TPA: oligosaccharide flippase family protein [Vicinamibacterales bacterium]|nr:oligosaccharide flippase family protein [Vicinamibacterales bacterium]
MSEPQSGVVPVTSHRGILTGVAALAGGEIGGRLVAFAATAWLTRKLGPDGFGIIGFATAISAYLLLATTTGFNDIGTRDVARHPDRAVTIAASAIAVRLLMGLAGLALLGVVALLLPKAPVVKAVIVLSGLSFLSQAIDISWVLRGLERNVRVGAMNIATQLLYAAGILAFVDGPEDVIRVPIIQFGSELAAGCWLCVGLFGRRIPRASLREGLGILKASGFVTASRLMRVVILTSGLITLGLVAGEAATGVFAAAYRFCFLLIAIAAAVNNAFLPSVARAADHGANALRDVIRSAVRIMATIAAPIVLGGAVTAGPLLRLLFGPSFELGAQAFQILLISCGFLFAHATVHNILLAVHRTNVETVLFFVAALVALMLNVTLIPRHGIVGAAVAALAAEALIAVVGWVYVKTLGVAPGWRPLVPPAVSAGVMVAVLIALGGFPTLLQIPLGALVYGVMLVLTGGVRRVWGPHSA